MANRKTMPLLTELKELKGLLGSINIALLAELVDILCSVSFGEGPRWKGGQVIGFC
jgi:hypothetical protein